MRTIYTIGHSTRTIDQFIAMLKAHSIQELVDVRTVPKSRHNPQFSSDELAQSLRQADIQYRHLGALGGLRHPRKDSVNTGWQNASFRGFADYMATPEFKAGLEQLEALAEQQAVVIYITLYRLGYGTLITNLLALIQREEQSGHGME